MANAYYPGGAYGEGAVAQEENMFRRSDCHFAVRAEQLAQDGRTYNNEMIDLLSARTARSTLTSRILASVFEVQKTELSLILDTLGWMMLMCFPSSNRACRRRTSATVSVFSPLEAQRRIAAQLDTLIAHQVRYAVLGAFGCGAFRNPSAAVAKLYREEIERRSGHFAAPRLRHLQCWVWTGQLHPLPPSVPRCGLI